MFHLSLPVERLADCLSFYRSLFNAEVVELAPGVANVFVFGAQVTFHERADSTLTPTIRGEMHFGAVVSPEEWAEIRQRIASGGHKLLRCIEAQEPGSRAKLLIVDPSGNVVEVNSEARS